MAGRDQAAAHGGTHLTRMQQPDGRHVTTSSRGGLPPPTIVPVRAAPGMRGAEPAQNRYAAYQAHSGPKSIPLVYTNGLYPVGAGMLSRPAGAESRVRTKGARRREGARSI